MKRNWSFRITRISFLLVLAVAAIQVSAVELKKVGIPKILKKDFSKAVSYEVIRVVDGDTFVVAKEGKQIKIRLIGVDTPETVHPQKPVEFYGKEASQFLANFLKGEKVYLEYEPGVSNLDRYGRTLAYVFRAPDGLFVNLEIVRQGYGHAYTKYPFQYMELFRFYERKAREVKKGLWGDEIKRLSK